ncbi:hypothetical protein G9A89_003861 [Geosiphon pyriformis]|nr:hypothetical protein G9A89_003861 [Geosiphon pyriformis]
MNIISELPLKISQVIEENGGLHQILLKCIEKFMKDHLMWKCNLFKTIKASAKTNPFDYAHILAFCYHNAFGTRLDRHAAFEWYGCSAELGNSFGQYMIAWSFEYSYTVEKNLPFAFDWYLKSASKDNKLAIKKLGQIFSPHYFQICGRKKEFGFFEKTAEFGNKISMRNMAKCFESGLGTNKDIHKAILSYRAAMKNGDLMARDYLYSLLAI